MRWDSVSRPRKGKKNKGYVRHEGENRCMGTKMDVKEGWTREMSFLLLGTFPTYAAKRNGHVYIDILLLKRNGVSTKDNSVVSNLLTRNVIIDFIITSTVISLLYSSQL